MSTESSRLIGAAIAGEPAKLLKSAGFRKDRNRFYKAVAGSTLHVRFQSSMWNSPNRAEFTATLWAYHPAIAIAQGESVLAEQAKQFAHAGLRIGHLLPQQQDHWWAITCPEEIGSVSAEVAGALADYGLPYLDRISTLEGIAELGGLIPGITDDPTPARATALALLGRDADAEAMLQAVHLRYERIRQERARDLAELAKHTVC